jgi:hypothetical protein
VQEELALWDLVPSGPLDGSVCFFPCSDEKLSGLSTLSWTPLPFCDRNLKTIGKQKNWKKHGTTRDQKELRQRKVATLPSKDTE